MAEPRFRSPQEFREVIDRTLQMISEDADMGPRLREADVPQRFQFDDVGLTVNIRAARAGEEGGLHWEWGERADWEPRVRMTMSSSTANAYFRGRENMAISIARRRTRAQGDVGAAIALLPITKAIFPRYRAMVAERYPHLAR